MSGSLRSSLMPAVAGYTINDPFQRHLQAYKKENPEHTKYDIQHLHMAAVVCKNLGYDIARSADCIEILRAAVKEASEENGLRHRDEHQTYREPEYCYPTIELLASPLERMCEERAVPRLPSPAPTQPPSLT